MSNEQTLCPQNTFLKFHCRNQDEYLHVFDKTVMCL